jgi:sugar/nucleoside kinase (ribokinase family)
VRSIAIAGHVCVDIRPDLTGGARLEPGRLFEVGPAVLSLGGPVGNSGRDLVALGVPVTVFAVIGDDRLGGIIRAELESMPLVTSALREVAGASTSYSIVLEPPGADRTFWHHVGANAAFDGTGLDAAGIDLLHLGYPPLLPGLLVDDGEPLHRMLAQARRAGATTSVDLADVDPTSPAGKLDWHSILRRMASETDVLTPSLDDLTSALRIEETYSPGLVARLADQLLEWGAAVVAISAGEHGLHLRTGTTDRLAAAGRALSPLASTWADTTLDAPALASGAPATTNGAGDASTAGLLFGIARGANPEDSARLASVCAAAAMRGRATTADVIAELDPGLASLFAAPR